MTFKLKIIMFFLLAGFDGQGNSAERPEAAVKPELKTAEKANTVYKYKQYEVLDLGSLEVKGKIMAPGDFTINERERKVFKRSLLEKENFDFENKREIENLR